MIKTDVVHVLVGNLKNTGVCSKKDHVSYSWVTLRLSWEPFITEPAQFAVGIFQISQSKRFRFHALSVKAGYPVLLSSSSS